MSIHVEDMLAGSTSACQAVRARVASDARGRPALGEREGSSEPAVEVGAEASGLVVAILTGVDDSEVEREVGPKAELARGGGRHLGGMLLKEKRAGRRRRLC